MSQTWPRNQVA